MTCEQYRFQVHSEARDTHACRLYARQVIDQIDARELCSTRVKSLRASDLIQIGQWYRGLSLTWTGTGTTLLFGSRASTHSQPFHLCSGADTAKVGLQTRWLVMSADPSTYVCINWLEGAGTPNLPRAFSHKQ